MSNEIARAFIFRARAFLLSDYLPKIERCLEQLTDDQIWARPNAESNSIGNLILHLCGNSRQWIISGLGNQPDQRTRDAEFAQRGGSAKEELVSKLRATLAGVEAVLTSLDSATLLEKRIIQGKEVDVLEAIFHVTEHFSMHTGQIIFLTKLLTASDLHFYDFEDGVPMHRWHSARSPRSDEKE